MGALSVFLPPFPVLWWGGRSGYESPHSPPSAYDPCLELYDGRIAFLEISVALDPKDAASLFELGDTYMLLEVWEQAIKWFTLLLEVEPENNHARMDLGLARMSLGEFAQAEETLMDLLQRTPEDAELHYILGFLYAISPNHSMLQAEYHWEEVARLAPGSDYADSAKVHLGQFQP